MSVKVQTFGGKFGWIARKSIPRFSSTLYTKLNFLLRRKETQNFISDFMDSSPTPKPLSVALETINRCNGTCGFCPCNVNDESRPYKKMTKELYYSIVQQLVSWGYEGRIVMNINNEPFIDNRIVEWTKYMREQLPKNYIYIITNGTLLKLETFKQIAPFINALNINNYATRMQLHRNVRDIANFVNDNFDKFSHLKIDIHYRYLHEVLSNRNGSSPSKQSNGKNVNEPCLEPYTAMYIFPDGVVGLCCFDALERTNLGNCNEATLSEIWTNTKFDTIRKLMRETRTGFEHCKFCDGFSKVIRTKLSDNLISI